MYVEGHHLVLPSHYSFPYSSFSLFVIVAHSKYHRGDNDLRVLSETHRPTNEQEEKRVKAEGGRITGERNKRLNGTPLPSFPPFFSSLLSLLYF